MQRKRNCYDDGDNMKIMHNGKFLEEAKFNSDFGNLSYEDGFFTTTRYENSKIFQWDAHLKRLEDSLMKHGIKIPKINLKEKCLILLRENKLSSARIKIVIYRRDGAVNWTIIMNKLEINKQLKKLKLKLKEDSDQSRFRFKTANYEYYIKQNKLAHQQGYDDFLFYDENERILETTFCNIFFQDGNKIITPSTDLPILPGVCRNFMIKSWKSDGVEVIEREIFLNELSKFSKCYVTNSVHGMVEAVIVK